MVKKRKQKIVQDTTKPEYEPPAIPGDKKPDNLASEQDHPDPNPK